MAFIRTKQKKESVYYYVVENVRESGKVRQKVIAYLGKCSTIDDAISFLTKHIEELKSKSERLTTEVERINNGQPFEIRRYSRWRRSEKIHNFRIKELQQIKKTIMETTERLRKIHAASSKI